MRNHHAGRRPEESTEAHAVGVGTFGIAGLWLVLALVLVVSILIGAASIWLAHRTLPEQVDAGHNGALSPF